MQSLEQAGDWAKGLNMCEMCDQRRDEESERGLVAASAFVGPDVKVTKFARVEDRARITGNVRLRNRARVSGSVTIDGTDVFIWNDAHVMGLSRISGVARVSGTATISGWSHLQGSVTVRDRAKIEDADLLGNVTVEGDSVIADASVYGGTFRGNAEILERDHYLFFQYKEGAVTLHRTKGGGHLVNAGCQSFELGEPREWYEELAKSEDWVLPEYWDHMMKVMEIQAESWK